MLYPAHTRANKGTSLRHCDSEDIAISVVELNAALDTNERRGSNPQPVAFTGTHLCPCATSPFHQIGQDV